MGFGPKRQEKERERERKRERERERREGGGLRKGEKKKGEKVA